MGGCHRAGAVFGVWFIMLGAADRPGADVVAADSGEIAGQNRPSQRDGVFADFPDGERPPPLFFCPRTPCSTHARAATAENSDAAVRSFLPPPSPLWFGSDPAPG